MKDLKIKLARINQRWGNIKKQDFYDPDRCINCFQYSWDFMYKRKS